MKNMAKKNMAMKIRFKYCLLSVVLLLPFEALAQASNKVFTVVTLEYPPYITEPQAIGNSWVWDVIKAAMEPKGYDVEVTIMPWARALEEAKLGHYDGLYGAFWTKGRLQWFEFSLPIGRVTKGFYRHKDREDIVFNGDLTTLKNYAVGVGRGFATTRAFDQADFLNKHFVTDVLQGAKMLYVKRLDLMVASREADIYRWQRLKEPYDKLSETLVFIEPALEVRSLYIAMSKKAPGYQQKLRDLNSGVAALMLNGTYRAIQQKHGFIQ